MFSNNASINPPVDLHLIFEKYILKNGFLQTPYFEIDFSKIQRRSTRRISWYFLNFSKRNVEDKSTAPNVAAPLAIKIPVSSTSKPRMVGL